MEEDINSIINRNKSKKTNNKAKKILSKFLISIILVLSSLIYINYSSNNKEFFQNKILTSSMNFTKINNLYNKYFGSILPSTKTSEIVFNNTLSYYNIEPFLEGEVLTVTSGSMVSNLKGGIVVFIGEKEGYGNTVIIQGSDGYDIWYGNLTNVSVALYDYLDKETIIGETINDKLYLVIKKDDAYIKYEEYKN